MSQRLLYISNGHGEDNHSAHVIRTLRAIRPDLEIGALPIVGEGNDYHKLNVPIIGPTYTLPSGGFTFMNRLRLINDIRAGLLTMTWKQFQAMKQYASQVDFVAATGDAVGQAFAYLSGKPFVSFISPLSSTYEGTLNVDFILWNILKSERCRAVFTRDAYTAEDLRQQGLEKIHFGGIPALDRLKPTGKDLQLADDEQMVALLPGSRTAEAVENLKLEMQLVLKVAQLNPGLQFRAALVPSVLAEVEALTQSLQGRIARTQGWQYEQCSGDRQADWVRLSHPGTDDYPHPVEILCYSDAFSDIAYRCNLVIGMAGLAVNHAMAIGKPIVQIAGQGPQFTYAFAEAQQRLLGLSVQTIGKRAATPEILQEAAHCVVKTLDDASYLQACEENGRQRFGPFGASARIANSILKHMDEAIAADPTHSPAVDLGQL
ncbi:lipid-A-disaccharide synthase-related protein [Leptolyngbya sp. BC1307]|uniref:lipid-A-disaccharide synthase-related protein n=1 Tax=Leptolyngbya sp. BC1307 TaxID=2029589 RepID=UPI000EFD8326|nr:lipid-A-disaccharide synthase-related protein [Leptolyngbya sp. BC1307]